MFAELTRDANARIFASQGSAAVHVDGAGTRTPCQVILSENREMASDFAIAELVGPRRYLSVRDSEVAAVRTGDTFEVDTTTWTVDARVEVPGNYYCITVAVFGA